MKHSKIILPYFITLIGCYIFGKLGLYLATRELIPIQAQLTHVAKFSALGGKTSYELYNGHTSFFITLPKV